MEKIHLNINGVEIVTQKGRTILEAARENGIRIPSLCHEDRLEPYGACRVCLVEVEGARGLLPACATKITDGMVIKTETEQLRRIRKTVIELLLSDHPLDCMTCESGGDCELQDLAYEYNVKDIKLTGEVHQYDISQDGPLIERDYDKCILCGRCVRICREVQGVGVYDLMNRGFDAVPGTPRNMPLEETPCEFCGQCVSACPTGAIISVPAKGKGRKWQLDKVRTTCTYCGVGCQFFLNVRDGEVVNVTSDYSLGEPNFGNLCVKGRFGFDFIHHQDRLKSPLIKRDGKFEEATWDEALDLVVERLGAIKKKSGPDSIAILASARCTNEENYLIQKFARATIGTNNVDHCARL
jgi:predicted molibdopterin-dependent oxidoreductase YjgC